MNIPMRSARLTGYRFPLDQHHGLRLGADTHQPTIRSDRDLGCGHAIVADQRLARTAQ